MNIISIGNFTGRGWDGSITDENHIADALEELGHKVFRWQREDLANYLYDIPEDIDFVLISQWDGYDPIILYKLKATTTEELQCPIVYWAFDYQADGQEWHERLIKQADLYLSKRITDSKYPNWQWLSQDFAPKFLELYKSGMEQEKDIEVLFTGSYLDWATERNETIRAVNDKYKLVIHSVNPWPPEWNLDVRPPIMDEGLPELYSRAKVILSIDHTIEAGYWSDRNAQIMACGRVPVFRYVPLSEFRFEDKVDYFYSPKDCLKKIQAHIDYKYTRYTSTSSFYAQEHLSVRRRVQDLLTIVEGIL